MPKFDITAQVTLITEITPGGEFVCDDMANQVEVPMTREYAIEILRHLLVQPAPMVAGYVPTRQAGITP